MQESRPLQPDVDERRLHAGQYTRHLAKIDVTDHPALQRALDLQLLYGAVLDDCNARFLRRPVDQDVLLHGVLGRSQSGKPALRSSCAVSNRGSPMMPE